MYRRYRGNAHWLRLRLYCRSAFSLPLQSKVADTECSSLIPDPDFFHRGSRIADPDVNKVPDPRYRSANVELTNNLSTFNPKQLLKISRSRFFSSWFPDSGFKKSPNPGSRIRNTAAKTTFVKNFCSTFLRVLVLFLLGRETVISVSSKWRAGQQQHVFSWMTRRN